MTSWSEKLKEASALVLALAAAGATSGLLIVLAMALSYNWGRESVSPEGPAAWVQAGGSILAILVTGFFAVWTTTRGERQSTQNRKADESALFDSCYQLADDAAKAHSRIAKKINGEVPGEDKNWFDSGRLRSVDQSILVMLSKNITAHALIELLTIRRELALTIGDIEVLNMNPGRESDFERDARGKAHTRTRVIEKAANTLRELNND